MAGSGRTEIRGPQDKPRGPRIVLTSAKRVTSTFAAAVPSWSGGGPPSFCWAPSCLTSRLNCFFMASLSCGVPSSRSRRLPSTSRPPGTAYSRHLVRRFPPPAGLALDAHERLPRNVRGAGDAKARDCLIPALRFTGSRRNGSALPVIAKMSSDKETVNPCRRIPSCRFPEPRQLLPVPAARLPCFPNR